MAGKLATEGAMDEIAAMVGSLNSGSGGGFKVGLFKSPHTPVVGDTLATYLAIESTFPGYAQMVAAGWSSEGVDGLGGAFTQMAAAVVFTVTGANAEFAYGYFIYNNNNSRLLGAEEFPGPGPYDMSVSGTTLGVQLSLSIDPA